MSARRFARVSALALLVLAGLVAAPALAEPAAGAPSSAPADAAAMAPATAPAVPRPQAAAAAMGRLSGQLRERGTREPVIGVTLLLSRSAEGPAELEASSDADGAFALDGLEPGTYHVHVAAPGYHELRTSEVIEPGELTSVTYYLERFSDNPFDVTVTQVKPKKEVSRTSLSTAELEKVPGVTGDPLAVVQNLAGVARSDFASGQLVVRGSAPEDSRVFVEGIELPLIYHFGGLRSVIPLQMLSGLDFYPGNFTPAYGRATGGVVDARLARLEPTRFGGSVDVSLLDTSIYLHAPLGSDLTVAIAGRRSYIGDVLRAVLPADTLELTTAPRYYDAQLLARYRPAREHELSLFLLGSDDRLELVFESPADLDPALTGNQASTSERFYRALVSHRYLPNRSLVNRLDLAYGYTTEDDALAQLVIDVETHRLQLRDELTYELGRALSVTAGVDAELTWLDVFVRAPSLPKEGEPQEFDLRQLTTTRVSERRLAPAAYVSADIEPWRGLKLLPGLRVDRFGGSGDVVVQPRLSARLGLLPGLTLKAGVGLFAQDPSDDELNPDFGNPDLGSERALHYSAGLEYQLTRALSVDATAFYKELYDLVSRTDAVVQDGSSVRELRYDNGGQGQVYGAELVLRHEPIGRFSGWLAYTLSRSERTDSGASSERLFDFDQTHILTLVGSYRLGAGWQLGTRFRYVSGNPLTPVIGATFDADADRYEPIYGATNSARDPAFHQLDVRIDKRWTFDAWMLNAYLEVQNVYNRANADGLSYRYDYREAKRQTGLPLLPVLGLRAEF